MSFQGNRDRPTLALLASLAITGCDHFTASGELTRAKAAALLKEAEATKSDVRRGLFYTRPDAHGPGWEDPVGLRDALLKAGYLAAVDPKSIYGRDTGFQTAYALTDKGKAVAKDWQEYPWTQGLLQDLGKTLDWKYSPPLAEAELLEVTDITGDRIDAIAEFRWHWMPNALGKEAIEKEPSLRMDFPAQEGRAAFRKYDDGWRLVEP